MSDKAKDEKRARDLAEQFFGDEGSTETFERDLIMFVLKEVRAERDAELQRAMAVVDACVRHAQKHVGCWLCGIGTNERHGTNGAPCPLVAFGFIDKEGKRL